MVVQAVASYFMADPGQLIGNLVQSPKAVDNYILARVSALAEHGYT